MQDAAITPGFIIVQGNQLEDLRDLAVAWMKKYPLGPLEDEVVLAQSAGIAQWFKFALAEDPEFGIAAALDVQFPSGFMWQAYRTVLGADAIPATSPLDKTALRWRLMRLLPALLNQADAKTAEQFKNLERYLSNDKDGLKRYQLAERIADLFDQYQVYRADWLEAWASGDDKQGPRTAEDIWQPALWRAVLADVGDDALLKSRAGIHGRFKECIAALNEPPKGLPRRVIVFGISSVPVQTLEALKVLSRFSQVLFCVQNPCQHYWGDIVADKDKLKGEYKRQPAKFAAGEASHGHPLLAAWGKQGRDYLHMLDLHDQRDSYSHLFSQINRGRTDLFTAAECPSMLSQLQDDILDLRTLAETREHWGSGIEPAKDLSIRFHVAHSAQREVEILHDQLLARFDADPGLSPRDVIVMLPDVNAYAPHIKAVFGQIPTDDKRYIPFSLADQGQRGRLPLLIALEHLLKLPQSRFCVSEILDLLDVAALRNRYAIEESSLPTLRRWIEEAGIRWGLNAEQRGSFGMPAELNDNTWQFGLRRMLLGYAAGDSASGNIAPYGEVFGLEAALLGPLISLLEHLDVARAELGEPATPEQWVERMQALLQVFFKAEDNADKLLLKQLTKQLDGWFATCDQAGFVERVPLRMVHEEWLAGLDQPALSQRFLGGSVNVCTLMPMRAIPFKVVCLLGMNDGDYPRQQQRFDFDLMQNDYRPGDRSRREDDRYLFLEALLSARQQLYLSWVGRSIRNNSEQVPSVLIGQLRDHLAAGWKLADSGYDKETLLKALTLEHPLQPFSLAYFGGKSGMDALFTYSQEWRKAHEQQESATNEQPLEALARETPLTLKQLGDFMRDPVKAFFSQRLKVYFPEVDQSSADDEVFSFDGLENWKLQDDLSQSLKEWAEQHYDPDAAGVQIQAQFARLKGEGKLPLAGFAQVSVDKLGESMPAMLERYHTALADWAETLDGQLEVKLDAPAPGLADWLGNLRRNAEGQMGQVQLISGELRKDKTYKWHRLIKPWLQHLAMQVVNDGDCVTTLINLSEDVVFQPMDRDEATQHLKSILQLWVEGMQRPLPLACKTAFAWLEAETESKALQDAENEYEGDYGHTELSGSPTLQRCYPDFEALLASGKFTALAKALYGPLFQHLKPAKEGSAA